MLNVVMLNVVMLNVIMLSVVMLNVIMLSVVILYVILLKIAILYVDMLNIIMLSVMMLNVIKWSAVMLSAVLLNVIMLNVVILCVAAPSSCYSLEIELRTKLQNISVQKFMLGCDKLACFFPVTIVYSLRVRLVAYMTEKNACGRLSPYLDTLGWGGGFVCKSQTR